MKYSINKDPRGPLYLTEDDKIKLNYNCPDSEKSGEGKGSCGGVGKKESGQQKSPTGKSTSKSSPGKKERFGGRNIMEVENSDLSLKELKEKLSVAKEGHDDDVAEIVEKDIKYRQSNLMKTSADEIKKSFELDNDATDDFAENMGTKPEDEEILSRGIDVALNKFGLSGGAAKLYAKDYLKSYDKAWKRAEKDAKDQGWK